MHALPCLGIVLVTILAIAVVAVLACIVLTNVTYQTRYSRRIGISPGTSNPPHCLAWRARFRWRVKAVGAGRSEEAAK